LILAAAAVAVAAISCKQKDRNQQKPQASEEPASAIEEPLLLLDDSNAKQEPAPVEGPVADNSRCHVCHLNYSDEELATVHARANIGCQKCHGACDAHCSDEDNITPPDIMYPLAKINSSCMACHPKDAIDTPSHGPIFEGTATEKKYCTDCHGSHRLSYRTRRWNKETGELLEDDSVRMMTDEMLKEK